MNHPDESFDPNKLSQKELIVLMYQDIKQLKSSQGAQDTRQQEFEIAIAVLKTKLQLWSAVIGFATGLVSSILMLIIAKALN